MKPFDPATYRECNQPKSPAQAEQDWEAFTKELYDLRLKHQIPELYLVATHRLVYDDGEEGIVNGVAHFGDQTNRERTAAWAFGFESANRQRMIAQMVNEGNKQAGDSIRAERQPKLF